MNEDIQFGDRRIEIREDGTEREIVVGIPECCREGWDSCPHVLKREPFRSKKNIGL